MGGKPSKATPADRRLKENRGLPAQPKQPSPSKSAPRPMPMPMQPRRGGGRGR